jgi:two-component system response regulator AtoC
VQLLAEFFLTRFNARQHRVIKGFSDEALKALLSYSFPGNVRELQNAVERSATFCDSPLIEARHLPQRILEQPDELPITESAESMPAPLVAGADPAGMPSLESVQRRYIHQVLKATQGNKRKAADILGITRRTLYRWLT